MTISRLVWTLGVAMLLPLSLKTQAANAPGTAPVVLAVKADHADALYTGKEPLAFVVSLTKDGAPVDGADVKWTLSKDGVAPVTTGTAHVEKGAARIPGLLAEPGFLQCRVEYQEGGKTLNALGGAGISPRAIQPSLPAPDDFDAFWAAQKAELAKVPVNARLTPVASGTLPLEGVEVLDVQADCVDGVPVSGYLARPAGAKPGGLPAILSLQGAGVRSSSRGGVVSWARDGLLALDINAHGLPNGKPQDFYEALANGDLKGYWLRGRDSRETLYFRGMFLRVLRALDVLTAQPEWDGRTLIIYGTSQGGAQSILGAALDSRVTFLVAGVPAMCDHSGAVAGRIAGWPKLVPVKPGVDGAAATPDAAILKTARYYDMVNFAARVRVPARFTVGFIDHTCPPSTVYAAFNALPGEKQIFNDLPAGHENTPAATRWMREAVLAHIASMKQDSIKN